MAYLRGGRGGGGVGPRRGVARELAGSAWGGGYEDEGGEGE